MQVGEGVDMPVLPPVQGASARSCRAAAASGRASGPAASSRGSGRSARPSWRHSGVAGAGRTTHAGRRRWRRDHGGRLSLRARRRRVGRAGPGAPPVSRSGRPHTRPLSPLWAARPLMSVAATSTKSSLAHLRSSSGTCVRSTPWGVLCGHRGLLRRGQLGEPLSINRIMNRRHGGTARRGTTPDPSM